MDVPRHLLGLDQKARQRLVRRHRAGPVQPLVGDVAAVERPRQPLPAVFVGLVEHDQLLHLLPPVFHARLAQRLQEIEAAHDLGQPLHLALVGRIDSQRRLADGLVDGEATLWLTLGVDFAGGVADYVRITPGSRLGTVQVRCAPEGDGTRVEVDYRLTSISEAGDWPCEFTTWP